MEAPLRLNHRASRGAARARAALVVVLALTAILSPAHAASVAAAPPGFERWAFYVTYDPTSRQSLLAHLDQLDHVAPGYFGVAASGALLGADDPLLDGRMRAADVAILPLVQNRAKYAALHPLLTDSARRAALVATLAALPHQYGYDGLTLDFEGIQLADRDDLTALITDLAGALHRDGKLLAVAVPPTTGDVWKGWAAAYDDLAIGGAADRVIVMAYAYRIETGQPGPISPFPWVTGVADDALAEVPADRLLLGVGTWGYDWDLTQPGPAVGLRYDQVAALVRRFGGQPSYDAEQASVSYRYAPGGDAHAVWYEDAASVQVKVALAARRGLAGVALWRLGEEAPGVWEDLRVAGQADFPVSRGWFFAQAGGETGFGYRVTDDGVPFWREFRRLGGVGTLGYASSRRFVGADGFTEQAFQRGVLQWRPERGEAVLVNTFDDLNRAGWDPQLLQQGIPAPIPDDGSAGDWQLARQTRLGWLTDEAIAHAFSANPNPPAIPRWSTDDAIRLYGLPASPPVRSGPFIVQRFQRVALQLWVDAVPGMPPPGTVVGILGGDLAKQAGLVPPVAAAPEPPFESEE